jgi:hypothetical protein
MLVVTLLEHYPPQSAVITTTLNLLERHLIERYTLEREYALDYISPNPKFLSRIDYHPQTCKVIKHQISKVTPENYGINTPPNIGLQYLGLFALIHDIKNTCPEVISEYKANNKTLTI